MQNRNSHTAILFTTAAAWAVLLFAEAPVVADDWMTWQSTYTHEPHLGQRVDQYLPAEQPVAPYRADFTRSGFRHFRSTLQAGQSADNVHVVEQWGRQVVPYEQWRFPYRPYAVPYDAWGPQAPYGIFNGSYGAGAWGGANNFGSYGAGNYGPVPGSSFGPPNASRGFPLTPQYNNEPWYDGNYPTAPPLNSR